MFEPAFPGARGSEGEGTRVSVRRQLVFMTAVLVLMVSTIGLSATAAISATAVKARNGSMRILVTKIGTTPRLDRLALRDQQRSASLTDPDEAVARIAPSIEGEIGGAEVPQAVALPAADSAAVTHDTPELIRSWEGVNSFDPGWNDNGNTFFLEPPDQGLCAGKNFVLETVNGALQIYTTKGAPLLRGDPGIATTRSVGLSLNQFYGYPPVFVFPDGPFGPFLTDPSCYYDPVVKRWFHVVLTLEQDPVSGAFLGPNHLDIAVSRGASPLGRWDIYTVPVQNDGSQGTPDHNCNGEEPGTTGPCIGDYPHIGADANGFYITTNEYAFFASSGYSGAQLYAFSKAGLAKGSATDALLFENLSSVVDGVAIPGFTVRPAWARPTSWDLGNGGTEYFTSGTVGDGFETNVTEDNHMVVWALTNTSTLGSASPTVSLHQSVVETLTYVHPHHALQADGPTPFLDCLNLGNDCFFGDFGQPQQEAPYPLDAGDGRVMSSFLADGVLWTTADTALEGTGAALWHGDGTFDAIDEREGVIYAAFEPSWSGGVLSAGVLQQGYVAVEGNNITYPSLIVGEDNQGFMGVTLVGPDDNPSPAYVPVGLGTTPDTVKVVVDGSGPSDGFSGTIFGGFRPRWGDYGYAVPGPGGTVWLAAEYISATCEFDGWVATVGNCDSTRTIVTNWTTRVFQLAL